MCMVWFYFIFQSQSRVRVSLHLCQLSIFFTPCPMDKDTWSTVFLAPPRRYHPHWSQCQCQSSHTAISDQNCSFCIFILGVSYRINFTIPLGHGFIDGSNFLSVVPHEVLADFPFYGLFSLVTFILKIISVGHRMGLISSRVSPWSN